MINDGMCNITPCSYRYRSRAIKYSFSFHLYIWSHALVKRRSRDQISSVLINHHSLCVIELLLKVWHCLVSNHLFVFFRIKRNFDWKLLTHSQNQVFRCKMLRYKNITVVLTYSMIWFQWKGMLCEYGGGTNSLLGCRYDFSWGYILN